MVSNMNYSTMPFESEAFLLGANCTTFNCEAAGQMVVSRIVTTGSLNSSNSSCFFEVSTRAAVVKSTSIYPSQTAFSNQPSASVKHMASVSSTALDHCLRFVNNERQDSSSNASVNLFNRFSGVQFTDAITTPYCSACNMCIVFNNPPLAHNCNDLKSGN